MLEPRIQIEIDNEGIQDVARVNFDPNVKDWIKPKPKVSAEIVVTHRLIGSGFGNNFMHVDAGVREVLYEKRRKSLDQLDMRKYITNANVRE